MSKNSRPPSAHSEQPQVENPVERTAFEHMGRQLRTRRKELGLTSVQLARAVDIPQVTLLRYEKGQLQIPSLALFRIAQELSVPMEYFFAGL